MNERAKPSALEPGSAELAEPSPARDDSLIAVAVLVLGALLVVPGFVGLVS